MRNWVAQFFRAFSYVFIDTKLVPYRFVLEKLMEPPCALGGLIFKNENCPYSHRQFSQQWLVTWQVSKRKRSSNESKYIHTFATEALKGAKRLKEDQELLDLRAKNRIHFS